MNQRIKVMIAGIGGASLGTEICKSLKLAKIYDVFGCDISRTAYGLYENSFLKSYHISSSHYAENVLNACIDAGAKWLIPGGEQPNKLLSEETKLFATANVHVVTNSPRLVSTCTNKELTFSKLAELGIPIPKTISLQSKSDLDYIGLPCIVKPSTGTGGSVSVFFAVSIEEAMVYAEFIKRNGSEPIAQEYIDINEGEFTIGVLSLPSQKIVGSIALKRELNAKLSVAYRGRGGIISSGYSQGYIGEYQELCKQAENIAKALHSAGPINIQARVKNGKLMPFEINPRFSASTYLRAMAGFNEVDIMLRHLALQMEPQKPLIQAGWYLRSLTEQYVSQEDLK
ncbi:MAG: ATP-grasp domain-containing protein [Snowella sp.]|nr:ATP-grasp domain-containing protein [Snowella sp.]